MRHKIQSFVSAGIALLAMLGMGIAPAAAQGTGFYVGAGAGQTSSDLCSDPAFAGLSCDDKDTGIKVFGGYNFLPNFGVEAAWIDLGEASVSGPGGSGKVSVDGYQIAGVGILPINPQFDVFGKVGFYMWDAELTSTFGNASEDGTDLMFGFGGAWNFTPQLSLRAEWERFDVDDEDADLLSASIVFKF
ncbi:MAG: outer membrane beta-barrel protein [Burkholderiales bacterium]